MTISEFAIIEKFFKAQVHKHKNVILGIGDDAALLTLPPKQVLAVSMDTLIAGVHFPVNTPPCDIGHKALAVNLSDMAAMGATPAWATLALTLPKADKTWLREFTHGFSALAKKYHVQLIGGDLTRGAHLSITVQIHGFVPKNKALIRSGARMDDLIYVSGDLGGAGLALQLLKRKKTNIHEALSAKLHRPLPRIEIGLLLRGIASSAIDISDGLLADLSHILTASNAGARLWLDKIPLNSFLLDYCSHRQAIEYALNSGDDYELCFTVPRNKQRILERKAKNMGCKITCIGRIERRKGLRLMDSEGKKSVVKPRGYRHFG